MKTFAIIPSTGLGDLIITLGLAYNLSKDFTVLIITHRLSTLKSCDKIFEIKKGIIKKILSHKKNGK
jgi:ABC-type multidrug transport system fused ATPase/permease subunit